MRTMSSTWTKNNSAALKYNTQATHIWVDCFNWVAICCVCILFGLRGTDGEFNTCYMEVRILFALNSLIWCMTYAIKNYRLLQITFDNAQFAKLTRGSTERCSTDDDLQPHFCMICTLRWLAVSNVDTLWRNNIFENNF